MKRLFLLVAAIALVCGSIAVQASVTVFTNRADWELAAGPCAQESFSRVTLDPNISVTSTLPGYVDTAKGAWWDSLYGPGGTGGPTTTTWTFSFPIFAFGGNWDCKNPGGPGAGIAVYCSGVLVGEIGSGYAGEFWGFVSTDLFPDVSLAVGTGSGWAETYYLDNLVYAPLPEPSALIALVAGLVPLIGMARRRA